MRGQRRYGGRHRFGGGIGERTFASRIWSRMAPRDRMASWRRTASFSKRTLKILLARYSVHGQADHRHGDHRRAAAARNFAYFGELIDKLTAPSPRPRPTPSTTFCASLGVVGCIVPWNYPLLMAAWKVAPLSRREFGGVETGRTVAAIRFADGAAFVEAGGPPGVFNVVNGLGETAGPLWRCTTTWPRSRSRALPKSASRCWFTPANPI